MRHRPSKTNPELAEISALLERVRIPDYERLRAQAHLERAAVIAGLIARAIAAVRSLASTLAVRLSHRGRERTA